MFSIKKDKSKKKKKIKQRTVNKGERRKERRKKKKKAKKEERRRKAYVVRVAREAQKFPQGNPKRLRVHVGLNAALWTNEVSFFNC